jgi:nucleoside-diphosphate-sugar epimerase
MRVLVAGASGAIGKPLIAALVRARHSVIGMTTSSAGIEALRERGADGLLLNALDREAVEREIGRIQPDAIIDELTSLPKTYTPEEMKAAAPRDTQVRLEGGGNLFRAAGEAGVKRYLVQSTGFYYAPGEGLASEADPLATHATPAVSAGAILYTQIESRTFSDSRIAGVSLRYGFFYGPGTFHDPQTGSITQQMRAGEYPVIDPGTGVFSFIHVEDAAAATVAALEVPPGVYNIVDDDPVPMAVWIPAFAKFVAAPPPAHVSEQEAVLAQGPDSAYYALRLRGASNAKAKKEFGFAPRRLEWLNGQ